MKRIKILNFLFERKNQNKRFARFATNLHRFSFFIILIQQKNQIENRYFEFRNCKYF